MFGQCSITQNCARPQVAFHVASPHLMLLLALLLATKSSKVQLPYFLFILEQVVSGSGASLSKSRI